jgi:hypothetical protein
MFLPEELDNKTFRLFVQRTWFLKQNGMMLSRSEQELSDLISTHPEISQTFTRKMLDVSEAYDSNDHNPFLYLAALWEIVKQVNSDKPKGVRSIYMNGFSENTSSGERRRRLARAFIVMCRQSEKAVSDLKYVRDLEKAVYIDFSTVEPEGETAKETSSYNIYVNSVINQSYSAVRQSFQKDADSKPIAVNVKLLNAITKLPTEWVEGMALGWQRPEKPIRKDRVQDLCDFLLSQEGFLQISAALSAQEREAITMVLEHGGHILYGKLEKVFGDETTDDYWWSEHPPKSVIGRLRFRGLLYVGKALLSSRHFKVAVIPQDLVSVLTNL